MFAEFSDSAESNLKFGFSRIFEKNADILGKIEFGHFTKVEIQKSPCISCLHLPDSLEKNIIKIINKL